MADAGRHRRPPGPGGRGPAAPRPGLGLRTHHVVIGLVVAACAAALVAVALAAGVGPGTLVRAVAGSPTPGAAAAGRSGTPTTGATTTARGPLVVVGLGDSVPSATTCDCAGYVEQLGTRLGSVTGRTPVVHNDAVGGWTTSDVERDLASASTHRDLAQADLVVVEVGANDFDLDRVDDPTCLPAESSPCWTDTLTGLHDGLTRIVDGIKAVDTNPDLRVAVVGYWNVTVDGAVGRAQGNAFVIGSDALTKVVNSIVDQVATATGAVYVDAYTPLKGEAGDRDPTNDLLDDGDHPNASGHTLLMEAVYDALEDAGAVSRWSSG
ncbi:SGNH/GDSL hydrolase family protein [Intrasporangium flavum]|uniref:SGNH/GDSL hydrolase family protein n=1 Tax=Intrasporangium flavum TaxID=1428657 RepID=UPI0009F82584|nr:SGNH/GDSL hydrolase family protein [Intrasporangium flavum]